MARPVAQPVLFHCAAGKDRTGVLAALVLSVLGCRRFRRVRERPSQRRPGCFA